jgi:hypothetical protein
MSETPVLYVLVGMDDGNDDDILCSFMLCRGVMVQSVEQNLALVVSNGKISALWGEG